MPAGASTNASLAIIEAIPDAAQSEKLIEKFLLDIHMLAIVDGKERSRVSPNSELCAENPYLKSRLSNDYTSGRPFVRSLWLNNTLRDSICVFLVQHCIFVSLNIHTIVRI